MIETKIRREVLKQATMYRLDYLTSQLPSRDQAYLIGRRLGRSSQMRCFQLLITEIQLTHQQLSNLMQERLPYFQSMQVTNYQDVVSQQQGMKHHERQSRHDQRIDRQRPIAYLS